MQWAAAHRDVDALRALAEYTRARHYSDLAPVAVGRGSSPASHDPDAPLALFRAIVDRQARLIAQWQTVGFIHGVMNTDNMALSGETIDYGPCAFMNAYDPRTVFSSIDHAGRYAYGNQPGIAQWNLTRLAEAMLPLFDPDQPRAIEIATAEVHRFAELFEAYWLERMRAKLGLLGGAGLQPGQEDDDRALVDDLLAWMHQHQADFTNTFNDLSTVTDPAWQARLAARRPGPPQFNPAFIPRNHKVEEALYEATGHNLAPMEKLLDVLRTPYDHTRDLPEFSTPPRDSGTYRTFCGT
jgi:uncharacterized protein YdiU (UPF0061 family)